jgi:hypothetical protein
VRLLSLPLAILTLAACGDPAPPPPPGPPAELLAAPFTEASRYARNVWDMQLFGGRIYLDGDMVGNRPSIQPPAAFPHRRRLPRAERPAVVPGQDPRGWGSRGTFYRLEAGGWARHRTVPHGIHTFDLAWHGGRLFAAIGGRGTPGQPTLLASTDRGLTWAPATTETRRMLVLFEHRGRLYAAPKLRTDTDPRAGTLLRLDGARFVSTGLGGATLLPGLPDTAGRIVRPVELGGALVYVVASGSINWKPAALAVTRTLHDARSVPLPDAGAVPYDLLVRGPTLFVLAAAPASAGGYTIHVYATQDLSRWRERVRFTAPTFARSFEESGGDFYFGLGSTFQSPSPRPARSSASAPLLPAAEANGRPRRVRPSARQLSSPSSCGREELKVTNSRGGHDPPLHRRAHAGTVREGGLRAVVAAASTDRPSVGRPLIDGDG